MLRSTRHANWQHYGKMETCTNVRHAIRRHLTEASQCSLPQFSFRFNMLQVLVVSVFINSGSSYKLFGWHMSNCISRLGAWQVWNCASNAAAHKSQYAKARRTIMTITVFLTVLEGPHTFYARTPGIILASLVILKLHLPNGSCSSYSFQMTAFYCSLSAPGCFFYHYTSAVYR